MRLKPFLMAGPALLLAACGVDEADSEDESEIAAQTTTPAPEIDGADSMASNGSTSGDGSEGEVRDPEQRPIMQAQVVLERQGFGPGVIDGKMGLSTENALLGFQEANGLEPTGELDEATRAALTDWDHIPPTRVVTIPQDWGRINFEDVPEDPAEQAQMQRLGYESLDEKLAERFHTTVEVLKQLNPDGRPAGMNQGGVPGSFPKPVMGEASPPGPNPASSVSGAASSAPSEGSFLPGQMVRVPNVGADRIEVSRIEDRQWLQTLRSLGVGTDQPQVTKVVVDKSGSWLKGFDADGDLVAMFTVTTGSENDPLPLGEWGINGVAHNPPFSYDPDLFWDVPDSEAEQQLPPGPNGPVGVVWIDLTKEHYGIHGTSAPETIGRAQSHGCVRLTNWDAARLAQMVDSTTEVVFQA